MAIIFTDFDGCLHPEPCARESDYFCRLPHLEAVLRDFPDTEVVISSMWRERRTLDELRAFFSPDIAPRVVGVTPQWRDLPELFEIIGYERQTEIEGWLRASGRPWQKWIAVDDRPWLFKPFLPNLVRCNPMIGIDEAVEAKLRNLLMRMAQL